MRLAEKIKTRGIDYREVFRKFDKNNDHKISKKEFMAGFKSMGLVSDE
jgi:Ca2+-binding EF-hand superfamily protein